jgi:hypothetical protein
MISELKGNECTNNEDVLNEVEAKIKQVDFQVTKTTG